MNLFFSCIFSYWSYVVFCSVSKLFSLSTGIQTVVERKNREKSSVGESALCTACEMAVVWIQNQLKQNQTKERILNYVNEVICLRYAPKLFKAA